MNLQKNNLIHAKKSTGIFLRSFLIQKFLTLFQTCHIRAHFVFRKMFHEFAELFDSFIF